MNYTYLDLLTTPGVIEAQRENGARDQWEDFAGKRQFTQFDDLGFQIETYFTGHTYNVMGQFIQMTLPVQFRPSIRIQIFLEHVIEKILT